MCIPNVSTPPVRPICDFSFIFFSEKIESSKHFALHAQLMHSNAQAKPQRNEKKMYPKTAEQIKIYYLQQNEALWVPRRGEWKCNWNASYGTSAVQKITEACEKCFSFTAFTATLVQFSSLHAANQPKVADRGCGSLGPMVYCTGVFGLSVAIMWHEAANWSAKWVAASRGRVRTWQVLSRASPSPRALTSCPGNIREGGKCPRSCISGG